MPSPTPVSAPKPAPSAPQARPSSFGHTAEIPELPSSDQNAESVREPTAESAVPTPPPTPTASASEPATEPATVPATDVIADATPEGSEQETAEPGSPQANSPEVYGKGVMALSTNDLPPVGTLIDRTNAARWDYLLTPSMQWAIDRGVTIDVTEHLPLQMEPWRVDATEKYHAQVRLAEDKKSLENYVAGIPFPYVTEDDPDAALKIIYNFESRIIVDDFDGTDFGCLTGAMDAKNGVRIERAGRFGHLRRLHYTGRLRIDPKPTWETADGIRHREALHPVIEPFNNKGAGFSYIRYNDPTRLDDSWLYLPATRRVRRLSTAQRSEGIFGVDIDLDSYGGFAGNPAWFNWKLLGKKTLLAPFHAKHQPIRWCESPGDFMFCDTWEPREFYILAARSLIPGYNFSLRVIYVDVQSMLIPFTEVYDHDGQLWRAYIQQFKAGIDRPMPYATESVYEDTEMIFVGGVSVFDMQAEHVSRCEFPAADSETEGWYYWQGDKEGGTNPGHFNVTNFINAGR